MTSWPDPISKNQLAKLLGRDRRTIDKKLERLRFEKVGRSHCYDLREAIEAVFSMDSGLEDGELEYLNPMREKALLDRRRREDIEINLEIKRGKIVPADSVTEALEGVCTNIRMNLLNIPAKMGQLLSNKKRGAKEIEKEAKTLINHCLKGLSEMEVDELIREDAIERSKSL